MSVRKSAKRILFVERPNIQKSYIRLAHLRFDSPSSIQNLTFSQLLNRVLPQAKGSKLRKHGTPSWICSTLTEFRFCGFATVNSICSLSGLALCASSVRKSAKRILFVERPNIQKKNTFRCSFFVYGTPKRIRIAVYTVKGCCPRPLDDGGSIDISYSTKSIFNVNCLIFLLENL